MKIKFIFGLLIASVLSINAVNAQTYCTPTSTIGCTSGDYIESFSTTGGITNITNNNTGCVGAGYSDYTTMIHKTMMGQTVNFSFTNNPNWSQGYKIWVDWNNNGILDDPGEEVYASVGTIGGGQVITGSFTVPLTATSGVLRLRIACSFASTIFDPCNLGTFGEAEDYSLDVGSENDAGVASLVSPLGNDLCSGIHQVKVNCRNFGTNDITSFNVNWTLNNVPQPSIAISTTLTPYLTAGDNIDVTLGNVNLTLGVPANIKTWTSDPNNVMDEATFNDTISFVLQSTFEGIALNDLVDTFFCEGDTLALDAGYNPNTDYTWKNGGQGQISVITTPGTHWVWAYNPSGCQAYDTFEVEMISPPFAGHTIGAIDNGGGQYTFNLPMAANVDVWEWNFGDAFPIVYGHAPIQHTYALTGSYIVSVKLSNACGETMRYGNVFAIGSNIKELENIAKSIEVYPSPATDYITIFNKNDKVMVKEITIFNSIGQRVFVADIKDQKSVLNVSAFATGLYNMHITTDKGNVNKKFEVIK